MINDAIPFYGTLHVELDRDWAELWKLLKDSTEDWSALCEHVISVQYGPVVQEIKERISRRLHIDEYQTYHIRLLQELLLILMQQKTSEPY